MSEIVIRYATLALCQQVLERQQGHAQGVSTYLPANADIGDSTGVLLSAFDPLSQAAVELGRLAALALGEIERSAAAAVGDTAVDMADSDGKVGEAFTKLVGRLGTSGPDNGYPDLQGPDLPASGGGAPEGYGGVESNFWEKAGATGDTLTGSVGDARGLIESVGQWGTGGSVTEVDDPSSYLVPGQAPENPVQDLRWSAGALLGGVDWVAEKFVGFSILDRCVYHPLAGDWQGIYKCAEAWSHAGDAVMAVGRNHAGLVASTPATWQGLSGNSFRGAMTTVTAGSMGLSSAFASAAGLVKTLATVCKLACTAIGMALKFIADKLIKMAAEAAVPVVGWAIGAATAYSDIQGILSKVRLIYSIFETIMSAIQDFAGAKVSIMDKLTILEDILQGAQASSGMANA